jgi:hypothetical protein
MFGLAAWGLAQLFVGLVVIPLPFIIFFGALALPLRKDQPMEIYMAAMVSYYLKPHRRLWDPEGVETTIEISAPKTVEVRRTKDLSQVEAEQRLSYLANIVDTQGWAIRGTGGAMGTAMNNDAYLEAQGAEDVLDNNTSIARNFDQMMTQSTARVRQEAREQMILATSVTEATPVAPIVSTQPVYTAPQPQYQAGPSQPLVNPLQPTPQPTQQVQYTAQPLPQPTTQFIPPAPQVAPQQASQPLPEPHFNPYPEIHQSVIQPLGDTQHQAENNSPEPVQPELIIPTELKKDETPPTTSDSELRAGIMNLANNSEDLSIETIAHEAQRLKKKAEEESEEVVISLR